MIPKRLIYISGIDGCGKTTQAKLLVERLKSEGYQAQYIWLRWEPSVKRLIGLIRSPESKIQSDSGNERLEQENVEQQQWLRRKQRILSMPLVKHLWLSYACADYYCQYLRHRCLFDSDIIVIDRYLDDFIIDQSINLCIEPASALKLLDNFFLRMFVVPDKRLIISLPPAEGYQRKMDGTSRNYLEQRSAYYQAISQLDNSVSFDGLKQIDLLNEEISACVLGMLK